MAKRSQTTVSNTTLKHAVKALDSWCTKHENGEFVLEAGTYKAFKRSSGVISCEMARQEKRPKARAINVQVITNLEQQLYQKDQFERQCEAEQRGV